MYIRVFDGRDTENIFSLWNEAHPNTPLSKELMIKKLFMDCNFVNENFLVAEEDGNLVAMAYAPHRFFSVNKNADREENTGFITYFAVKPGYSVKSVGAELLSACEKHHHSAGRNYITTAYSPLYFTQGFSEKYDIEYIDLFRDYGYSEVKSYSRKILLENYRLPDNFHEKKKMLEDNGYYIGPLQYQYISGFLNSDADFSSNVWSWQYRTKLSCDLDLEAARIAVFNDEVIGGCVFGDPNSDEGRFGPFGMSPRFRGKGIGTILFADCLSTMKSRGISVAWAQWTPTEGPAHALYEKAGFSMMDCYIMFSKELS